MARILVTGGAGFIGSHIADAMLAEGHDVHVLDNLSSGVRTNVSDRAQLHVLDIRDAGVADLWQEHRFEVLIHHAAQMDVRKSVADPAFDADVNLGGLINLMESGRQNGLRKVVFASTGGAIYGEPDFAPQSESHPLRPVSPYGITKLASEKYLFFYEKQYGISSVVLRYANVYGPRQNPHGEAGVVAIFCQRLLRGKPTTIHGDGEQTRDYVFVRDVVRANVAAVGYDDSGLFNVGTGVESSVNQLFRILRDHLAPSAPEKHGPGMPGEQKRSVVDPALAGQKLGWSPSVGLSDGLVETADWFKNREA